MKVKCIYNILYLQISKRTSEKRVSKVEWYIDKGRNNTEDSGVLVTGSQTRRPGHPLTSEMTTVMGSRHSAH